MLAEIFILRLESAARVLKETVLLKNPRFVPFTQNGQLAGVADRRGEAARYVAKKRNYLVTAVRDVTGASGGYDRADVLGGFDAEEEARALFNSLEATGRTREVCITVGGSKIASKRRGE